MLMVILGAGASYDSIPHLRASRSGPMAQRPPLANELFEERFAGVLSYYPQLQPIVPWLQNAECP